MKLHSSLLLLVLVAAGCIGKKEEPASSLVAKDFNAAIETIATASDFNSVIEAYVVVVDGGRPAIDALREHLADQRTIPGTYSTRSFNGGLVTMGDQSFFLIQDMIEPHHWKRQSLSGFAILAKSNVERWLDENRGKSITELKIEAASTSLGSAQEEFEQSGSTDSRKMIQFYRDRLAELHRAN